jgi:hypothetical protein
MKQVYCDIHMTDERITEVNISPSVYVPSVPKKGQPPGFNIIYLLKLKADLCPVCIEVLRADFKAIEEKWKRLLAAAADPTTKDKGQRTKDNDKSRGEGPGANGDPQFYRDQAGRAH